MNSAITYQLRRRSPWFFPLVAALVIGHSTPVHSQSKNPPPAPLRVPESLLLYDSHPSRVVETFSLIQQARSGIPAAQHELGYRYLVGRGIPADTAKAAEWIVRAAQTGMALAQYNAGILFVNAIGVQWNPFTAYTWFKRAALQELPAGEFVFGILLSEGLIVRRDLPKAFSYVKHSADQDYGPAKEVLKEFLRLGFDTLKTEIRDTIPDRPDSTGGLVMLHFDDVSNPDVGDSVLVREFEREVGDSAESVMTVNQGKTEAPTDDGVDELLEFADRGIPEAHMILGRMYERGLGVRKDVIRAGVHYCRAYRLDSPRSLTALGRLTTVDEFRNEIVRRAQEKDRDARYVWSVLAAIGLDEIIGPEQALRFLGEQSDGQSPHVHSCLELGFWYATGRFVPQVPQKAIDAWARADSLGAHEGLTRIALMELILRREGSAERTLYLKSESEHASILAQAGYAYSLEKGIGTTEDKPEAVSWYRRAAQRGSLVAYNGLKAMYDELRPEDDEFKVDSSP